ncbi:MAG: bifunctional UDP-4-keto-pentose/UDP-xylose synthase [Synergistaceae bacterium]|nr:bifunctional UDP-4-keto-pentose/UDP-xylose synthase [Synergistaceae bacterium]
MKILITGINGFIGTHLMESISAKSSWHVQGFDIKSDNLEPFMRSPNFKFTSGDIFKDEKWLEEQVESSDIVLPLAGIAKPAYYLQKPIWTFELDFEQNLKMVRLCSKYKKRIIFPSTSEVYGMSSESSLKEDESQLITGPINKMRWIYSCSKQMMDRLIFAYGQEEGLNFTLFRPFNWVGPRLDTFKDASENRARSITQMIYDVIVHSRISLVNGGEQRRSFTWIGDGIEGLIAIIENKENKANGQIFNIGNPDNNYSIKELAEMLLDEMKKFPVYREKAEKTVLEAISADIYYGKTYDDMQDRRPSVEKMETLLGWTPRTGMRDLLNRTISWYADQETLN